MELLCTVNKIKLVNPKGYQPLIFIGRTEAEAPILWLPDWNSWLPEKDPEAEKDWGQEEKVVTEEKMIGWHHWLNGHEFVMSKLRETVKDNEAWYAAVHGVVENQTWFGDWKATI